MAEWISCHGMLPEALAKHPWIFLRFPWAYLDWISRQTGRQAGRQAGRQGDFG